MRTNKGPLAIIALAVVDLALFMISGVPRFRDATRGADYVVSSIVWFGFLIGALALVVTLVTVLVRRARGGRRTAVDR
jgi:Kef-type K+ transport system membrane component KefB